MSSLVLKPKISEKAYMLSEDDNTYVFEVPKSANKISIKQAVEERFNVSVVSVNISNLKGKKVQRVKKNGARIAGRKPTTKRAYVKVKDGDKIEIFQEGN